MSRFAYDREAHAVTVSWEHAGGAESAVGFALPRSWLAEDALVLVRGMQAAADALWAGYCTGVRAGRERDGGEDEDRWANGAAWMVVVADGLGAMLTNPEAFAGVVGYDALPAWLAARCAPLCALGVTLAERAAAGCEVEVVRAGVLTELATEIAAVRSAYTGVLAGRAQQASVLVRDEPGSGAGLNEARSAVGLALGAGTGVAGLACVPGELAARVALEYLEAAQAELGATGDAAGRAFERVLEALGSAELGCEAEMAALVLAPTLGHDPWEMLAELLADARGLAQGRVRRTSGWQGGDEEWAQVSRLSVTQPAWALTAALLEAVWAVWAWCHGSVEDATDGLPDSWPSFVALLGERVEVSVT